MKQFGEKIGDEGVKAWYSFEEFGVKAAEWAKESKIAKLIDSKIKKEMASECINNLFVSLSICTAIIFSF